MSGAHVIEREDGFLVVCDRHSLLRMVETGQHAANLQALHNRVDHADDTDSIAVDLTAAAHEVMCTIERTAAMKVWQALTGILDYDDAWDYAIEIGRANPPIAAHIPPF
jgi:hypothetical protein